MSKSETSRLLGAEIDLLSPDIEYLVGVSGGRDSMVLLHWLVDHGFKNLIVCHFNHSLRGKDSDGDETFVKDTAKGLGLECVSVKNDSRIFAEKSKQSIVTTLLTTYPAIQNKYYAEEIHSEINLEDLFRNLR